jgi:hypothetical protein
MKNVCGMHKAPYVPFEKKSRKKIASNLIKPYPFDFLLTFLLQVKKNLSTYMVHLNPFFRKMRHFLPCNEFSQAQNGPFFSSYTFVSEGRACICPAHTGTGLSTLVERLIGNGPLFLTPGHFFCCQS